MKTVKVTPPINTIVFYIKLLLYNQNNILFLSFNVGCIRVILYSFCVNLMKLFTDYRLLSTLNAQVAVSKYVPIVKRFSNKILQFLTGGAT